MKPDRWPPLLSARSATCERFLGGVGEGLRPALGSPFLGHLIQFGLGALDLSEGGNVLTRVERAFDQVAAYADQRTEQRQIVDLAAKSRAPITAAPDPVNCAKYAGPPTSFILSSLRTVDARLPGWRPDCCP